MVKVDARGVSCPQPVLLTKNAAKSNPAEIQVLVDNNTAKSNIERFLKNSGYKNISFSSQGDDYIVTAKK